MSRKFYFILFSVFLVGLSNSIFAQDISKTKTASSIFKQSKITYHSDVATPAEIKLAAKTQISATQFFSLYKQKYKISPDNSFSGFKTFKDKQNISHTRYKQYYKGIEVDGIQYIVHEKNGIVVSANGRIIHDLKLTATPLLSEEEALQKALNYIDAKVYMWDNHKNKTLQKNQNRIKKTTYYPKGQLVYSCGTKKMKPENFRLTYKFDIYAQKPLSRDYIFVNAQTGEIESKISRLHFTDIETTGQSKYNGTVPIVISDSDYPKFFEAYWHTDEWTAYNGTGVSWWMANPELGNQGGYDNYWYMVLDTDPFLISGDGAQLTFYHRYAVEPPDGASDGYNGWDGLNVRISTDNGLTWQVLANPTPAYDNSSLYSFGFVHQEGEGIPGWTGELQNWAQVIIDLSVYQDQTVQLRFAFASDPAYSTGDNSDASLFGWQIDDILVNSSDGVLFSNDGSETGLTSTSLENEVEGSYRMREAGRSQVLTFDALNKTNYFNSIDFVNEDISYSSDRASVGVSVHWALEGAYDYFLSKHGRDSYDGQGSHLVSYVHYDSSFFNAFWNGEWMTFGDGVNDATPLVSVDICAHELTHGVTETSANLIYQNEPGALNESFSDIFAAAVEFFLEGENGDWDIGEDFLTFRSLSNPKNFSDPDTYQGFFWKPHADIPSSANDQGGVHSNSGVQNKWFYLLSEGESGTNDTEYNYNVTGIGIDDASQIAYRNLTVYLTPTSTYADARLGALNSAIDLFGNGSQQFQSVLESWNAVGVYFPSLGATISADEDSLDFLAELGLGADTLNVVITNFGAATLVISNIVLENDFFSLIESPDLPIDLEFSEKLVLSVRFAPETPGVTVSEIVISSNDTSNTNLPIKLNGRAFEIVGAEEDIIYTVSGTLFDISEEGATDSIGVSGFAALNGLAIRGIDNQLYSTVAASSGTDIVRVNSANGDAHFKTNVVFSSLSTIAFAADDSIFAVFTLNKGLYRININDGVFKFIGSTGIVDVVAIALDSNRDLYIVNENSDLYKVNVGTAQAELIGNVGFADIVDLAFDDTDKLLAIAGKGDEISSLISIITETGIGKFLYSTGQKRLTGIAIRGVIVTKITDGVNKTIPREFALKQNFPNPFNPETTLEFSLPQQARVTLTVYNLLGKQVTKLLSNVEYQPGTFRVRWDAKNYYGLDLATGVYIYRLKAVTSKGVTKTFTKKMILVK